MLQRPEGKGVRRSSVAFATLAAVAVATLPATGCISSAPGALHASSGNPLVMIGAGRLEMGGTGSYLAYYIVDSRAQTCWFLAGGGSPSIAPLDCCAVRRVAEATPVITWLDDAACAGR
ncbi:MAG: hypothetical protein HY905_15635 [Deltaproteobacteria bacterium]|nr:hypothetical protein [Deltaproteobacteria bacterium]